MEGVVRRHTDDLGQDGEMDTYANLLYKTGKRTEALQWEQEALKIAEARRNGDYGEIYESHIKIFQETIDKMEKGQPTWIVSDKNGGQKK
jgi:hypothetical protein